MEQTSSQLLRPKQVCSLLGGIHISTLYRWMDEGKFDVKKQRLGPRTVCFRKIDVDKWIDKELQKNSQSEPQKVSA